MRTTSITDSMPVLHHFAEDIWLVDGPSVRAIFVPLPTRMIVVKLGDGSLWINSPVVVPRETLDEIVAIGPVRYLVAPTTLHIWRLEQWRTLFPQAQLWGPPKVSRAGLRISPLPASYRTLRRRHGPKSWNSSCSREITLSRRRRFCTRSRGPLW
jgi:hypothetical protein